MPAHGPHAQHRRPIALRRNVYVRPRRSSPVFARSAVDNSLVLGPGGEAAIVPTQVASVGSTVDPDREDGDPLSQVNKVAQTGLLFSTEVVAVMGPDTAQPSASFAALSFSIGPASNSDTGGSTTTYAPLATTTTAVTSVVSSESSGISTQAASPASSTTPTSPTPGISSSSSSQTTFSSSSATASTRMSSNPSRALFADSTGLKVGVSFGVLAAMGLLAALLLWWVRMRQRTRTRKWEDSVAWPWEKQGQSDLHRSPAGLETGFGATSVHRDNANLWGAGCPDVVNSANAGLPTLPQTAHTLDTVPYHAVHLPHANNSVPDLAPNMGVLQVTNLVPGDISSGTESSRASSVLSMARTAPEAGSPFEPMARQHLQCLGAQDDAPSLPWPPLYVRSKPAETQRLKSSSDISEKSLGPLPYPGDVSSSSAPPSSWAALIRANIVHALHAVVKAPAAAPPLADNLTSPPRRRKRSGVTPLQHDLDALSRESSVLSSVSDRKEEVDVTDPYVPHLEARSLPPVTSWSSIPLEDDHPKTPCIVTEMTNDDRSMQCDQGGNTLDLIEDYYSRGVAESSSPHVSTEEPPRLPDILSHTPSLSSLAIVCEARAQRKSTKYKKGGTRRKTRSAARPALATRASSSLCSVGSDMSRQSSMSSPHLTDAEAMAKRMLRDRRRRVLEMGSARWT